MSPNFLLESSLLSLWTWPHSCQWITLPVCNPQVHTWQNGISRGHLCSLPKVSIFSRMIKENTEHRFFSWGREVFRGNISSVAAMQNPLLHLSLPPTHTDSCCSWCSNPSLWSTRNSISFQSIPSLQKLTRVSFCYLKPSSCIIGSIFLSLIKPTQGYN